MWKTEFIGSDQLKAFQQVLFEHQPIAFVEWVKEKMPQLSASHMELMGILKEQIVNSSLDSQDDDPSEYPYAFCLFVVLSSSICSASSSCSLSTPLSHFTIFFNITGCSLTQRLTSSQIAFSLPSNHKLVFSHLNGSLIVCSLTTAQVCIDDSDIPLSNLMLRELIRNYFLSPLFALQKELSNRIDTLMDHLEEKDREIQAYRRKGVQLPKCMIEKLTESPLGSHL